MTGTTKQPSDINSERHSNTTPYLNFAVAHSPVIYFVSGGDGAWSPIIFVSSNIEKITGHKVSDFLENPEYGSQQIHPDDYQIYNRSMVQVHEAGTSSYEYRYRLKNGEYRWFRDELNLAKNDQTGRPEIVGCMIDIHDRVMAEQGQQKTTDIFTDAIESISEGFALYDEDDRLVMCNGPYKEQHIETCDLLVPGVKWEDMIRMELTHNLYSEAVGREEEWLQNLIKARDNLLRDSQYERTDGRWISVSQRKTHQKYTVTIVKEITDQINKEIELKRSRDMLEDAIESLSEGFIIWDHENKFVTCNSRYRKINEKFSGLLTPEITWQEFLRAGAEAGHFPDAIGKVDKWVQERSDLREQEGEFIEYRTSDEKWLSARSRRTRQGGWVATVEDITERKEMESALRESEELVRRVLDSCPTPIVMVGLHDGRFIYESRAHKDMFQVDESDSAQTVYDRYPDPNDRKRFTNAINKNGRVDAMELELKRADGTIFPASISARLVKYKGKDVVVASPYDLSEFHKMQNAVLESEELLHRVLENCPATVVMTKVEDGRILYASPAASEIFDLTEDDVYFPRHIYTNQDAWKAYIVDLKARGRIDGFDALIDRRDGRKFWISISSRIIEYQGSKVIVSSAFDMTERIRTEQSLRESETTIRQILESAPVPITMSHLESSKIIYANLGTRNLFGYKQTKDGTLAVDNFVNKNDRKNFVTELKETGWVDNFEADLKHTSGHIFRGATSSRLIDYKGDAVLISSTRDLTDSMAMEAEISQQREALYQSEKLNALGTLLAGVSHELNNPLTVVLGQAQILSELSDDVNTLKRARMIEQAADRCTRIVRTFLAMARQQPQEFELVNLNEIVQDAVEISGFSLRRSNVNVTMTLADNPPFFKGSSDQLIQVATNIILNAEYSLSEIKRPRKINITTRFDVKTKSVVLRIRDNGLGISPEVQAKIFDPFFTTKEVGSGTGIGLALCQRIVEAHGGSIVNEKPKGEGTVFIVRLPFEERRNDERPKIPHSNKSDSKRILVVDDERDVAESIADMLRADDHSVRTAYTAHDALHIIASEEFDVVLSDLRMPAMDGSEFFETLCTRDPHYSARLACITGDTMGTEVRSRLTKYDCPFAEKPVSRNDLRTLIAMVVEKNKSRDNGEVKK